MTDLTAELEAAEEGSRELEIRFLAALGLDDAECVRRFGRILEPLRSVDDALRLVPEGFGAVSASIRERGPCSMRIGHPYTFGNAATPALALCAAILRANGESND